MIKIMFVCHGNICRSPMAEFLMKDYILKKGDGDKFFISSSATSSEELGNPVHFGTRKILDRLGISYSGKRAVRLMPADYEKYDYFIGMDERNRQNMKRIFNGDKDNKIACLLDYLGGGEVADPWWTGDFEKTFQDISKGIAAFYKFLNEKQIKKTEI